MNNQQERATEKTLCSLLLFHPGMEPDYTDMDAKMDLAEDLARAAELARCALKRAEVNGVEGEERSYARDGFYILLCQHIGPPSLPNHDPALEPDPSTLHTLTLQKLWERN
jgi:hypothetical protein